MTESAPDDAQLPANSGPSRPASAEDYLPPVEPPSAGFIVQLFVVPAAIVLVILVVWLSFNWLIRGGRPDHLIQGLQGAGVARWQRASELADVLRSDRYPGFKTSNDDAAQLAAILNQEIDAANSENGMEESAVTLRYFMCRALGEFQVDAGVDVLLKAATTDRDPREEFVRRGAIQALVVLMDNLRRLDPPQEIRSTELEGTLITLSNDDSDLIRSESAYALGVLGTDKAIEQLEVLVDDLHADTRYNAALALARHGNMAALPVLVEMLDPQEMSSIGQEKDEQAQSFKRSSILSNALKAIQQLVEKHPDEDFSSAAPAIEFLASADPDAKPSTGISRGIIDEAKRTLQAIKQRTVPAK
jgi:hypothetical protein